MAENKKSLKYYFTYVLELIVMGALLFGIYHAALFIRMRNRQMDEMRQENYQNQNCNCTCPCCKMKSNP
jgi:hypothetical protein